MKNELLKPIMKELNLLDHIKISELKNIVHHKNSTMLDHLIHVAYYSLKFAEEHKIDVDKEKLIRTALLHDYYFYNWHKKGKEERWHKPHGYIHPYIAAINAKTDYNISEEEFSAITTHMWPLNFFNFPENKIGWIIAWADKKAAFNEFFNIKI